MRYLLLLTAFCLPAHAEVITDNGMVTDSEFAAVQVEIEQQKNERCADLSVIKRLKCWREITSEYSASGKLRGTIPYIETRFMSATDEEIDAAIKERESLTEKARDGLYLEQEDLAPGEVTQKDLRAEVKRLVYLRYHAPERHCRISLDEAQAAVGTDKEAECK